MIRLLILLYSIRDWIHAIGSKGVLVSGGGEMNLDESRYRSMAQGLIQKAVHDAIRIVNIDAKKDGVKLRLKGFSLYLDSESTPAVAVKELEVTEYDKNLAFAARIKL